MHHGVLVVDKPVGPTSHDVVARLRRVFGTRAVGHAGTLDPMASGVLVVGVGEGTKLLYHLTGLDKAYSATVRLGAATDTLDAQGTITQTRPVPGLSLQAVVEAARSFVGARLQRVPEISAVKQQGVRLYTRARRGERVEAPQREVILHAFEIEALRGDEIELQLRCGKGFYVRALARDLAHALGTVGHLTRLRRTAAGAFSLADAIDGRLLSTPANDEVRQAFRNALLSPAEALRDRPRLTLAPEALVAVAHGRPVPLSQVSGPELPARGSEPVGLLDDRGVLRALGRVDDDRIVVIRGFVAQPQVAQPPGA